MKIKLCNIAPEGWVSDVCYICKTVKLLVRVLFALVLLNASTAINAKTVVGFIGGTVGSVDLDIYLPPVMDSGGLDVLIDDSSEEIDGGVVFVNLDNDDGDEIFDIDDTDGVLGEDDLAKLELSLKPYLLFKIGFFDSGEITLSVVSGEEDIKIYSDKSKTTVFPLDEPIPVSDFNAGDIASTVLTLYIEGIRPQISQRQTKLEMKFTNGTDTFTDEVSLTVIGVESIVWEGKGNSLTDTDELDPDPGINRIAPLVPFSTDVPPRAFNPVRVFPGKRLAAFDVPEVNPRNIVDVKVNLTVPPPRDISVFLRVFDMDDPTEDQAPADDDAFEGDNRGCTTFYSPDIACDGPGSFKTGAFIDPVTSELSDRYEMKFKASKTKLDEKVEFEVTLQPGDNFSVVASGDKDFLEQLENDDGVKAVPGVFPDVFTSTQAELDDNLRITDSSMTAILASENEVLEPEHYVSQILTVWRFLHFEVDSMEAAPEVGPNKNSVNRRITEIRSDVTGSFAEQIEVAAVPSVLGAGVMVGVQGEVNVDGKGRYLSDLSVNLDSIPPRPGRFENGELTFSITGAKTPVDSNGNTYLNNSDPGFNINFSASNAGNMFSGKVIAFTPPDVFKVLVLNNPGGAATWASISAGGGVIMVEGIDMPIKEASQVASTITVTAYESIPVVVRDEDLYVPRGAGLMGINLDGLPTEHFGGLQESDAIEFNSLAQVFIRPKYDLTNAAYSDINVPFISNSEHSDVYDWDTSGFMNDAAFWNVYILYAFQDSYDNRVAPMNADMDSNGELGTWASANNGANGGVLIYLESTNDGGDIEGLDIRAGDMNHLVAHEVGHNLSLEDHQPDAGWAPCTGGFMFGQLPFGDENEDCRLYIEDDINKIRILDFPKPTR